MFIFLWLLSGIIGSLLLLINVRNEQNYLVGGDFIVALILIGFGPISLLFALMGCLIIKYDNILENKKFFIKKS